MGAGSAALLWYACCCSFVAFSGILGSGLFVYGRKREARRRLVHDLRAHADALEARGASSAVDASPETTPETPPEAPGGA